MNVRIVVKPSKVLHSKLWFYDVEEKINDKWHMGCTFDGRFNFYGGNTEDKELAIELARQAAQKYIEDRKIMEHFSQKQIDKPTPHIEVINVKT